MPAEFDLIDLIARQAGPAEGNTLVGIGDDAAVLEPPSGQQLVATMDTLNAGVHFFPGADPYRLGHKALAVNLSDLASMGAKPHWALLSVSLPSSDSEWLQQFVAGFVSLARQHDARLVGGDTCQGPLSVTVTALGCVQAGQALLRSTAQPGDLVVVSGQVGLAGYALQLLRTGQIPSDQAREALERPRPRVQLGLALTGIATSCIDLSDGLMADLGHVTKASGCGAEIDLQRLPQADALSSLDPDTRWELQLGAGDDYELCFTCRPDQAGHIDRLARDLQLPLTVIGRMVTGSEVVCKKPDGMIFRPRRSGHEHFHD
jgi:thiamine-monophosphate kinase